MDQVLNRPRPRWRAILTFVFRIREIVDEYSVAGLGPAAAMAEIKAALRELDRRGEARQSE